MTRTDKDTARAEQQARAQLDSIVAMVRRLEHCQECDEEDREQYHNEDEARQAITEGPLSVEVRSGWHTPGEDDKPTEYCILLCTGGPACRIIGDLTEYQQPDSPRLEYQDWFTPWIEYRDITSEERDALLTYAQQFYFGN